MNTQNKLYKCYKDGCSFRHDHPDGPYLTQIEYDELLENGQIRRCPNDGYGEPCGIRELNPQDYPKPAKKPFDKNNVLKIGGSAIVILLVAVAIFLFTGKKEPVQKTQEPEQVVQQPTQPENTPIQAEPVKIEEPVKEEPLPAKPEVIEPVKPKETASSSSVPAGTQTKNFDDGSKSFGEMKNGKMHGLGTYYYKERQQISPKDLKKRMAEAGDYLIGEFYEGNVVQGKLYDAQNNLKGVVNIGR